MITSDGKSRIDSILAGEVFIQIIPDPGSTKVKFAFLNKETGQRFGSGNFEGPWSDEVTSNISTLLISIEKQISVEVFEESSSLPEKDAEDEIPSL